ncbi:MAG: hypothetical protein ACD_12C00735G0003 [uncultured bacterium]|nr:MAG: hypothetical protein ACD_12C00735G0003 [uncultured bacterium]
MIRSEINKGVSPTAAIATVREELKKRQQEDPYLKIITDKRKKELASLNEALKNSDRDALTGLYNRGYLLGRESDNTKKGKLAEIVERTLNGIEKGEDSQLSVAILDIDHFKKVNDRHGHSTGDEVLKEVAKVILEHMRSFDIAARYGGEEIVIILPEDIKTAHKIIERIRLAISQIDFSDRINYPEKITASFGLTNLTSIGNQKNYKEIGDKLVTRADEAMYLSKRAGRNRTTINMSTKNNSNLARLNEIVEL